MSIGATHVSRGDDPYNLQRFLDAQKGDFETACAELRRGRKRSHWIWYIFPQIAGLGDSRMSQTYAISGLAEAQAFLRHPVLGPRLREITRIVNALEDRPILAVFPYPDDLKFGSCMTLFAQVDPQDETFRTALAKYFAGEPDQATLDRLASGRGRNLG
jgi:uncharacterized protein (DUF1810 family)